VMWLFLGVAHASGQGSGLDGSCADSPIINVLPCSSLETLGGCDAVDPLGSNVISFWCKESCGLCEVGRPPQDVLTAPPTLQPSVMPTTAPVESGLPPGSGLGDDGGCLDELINGVLPCSSLDALGGCDAPDPITGSNPLRFWCKASCGTCAPSLSPTASPLPPTVAPSGMPTTKEPSVLPTEAPYGGPPQLDITLRLSGITMSICEGSSRSIAALLGVSSSMVEVGCTEITGRRRLQDDQSGTFEATYTVSSTNNAAVAFTANVAGFHNAVEDRLETDNDLPAGSVSASDAKTSMVTQPDDDCTPYRHDVTALEFKGVGSNCRGGINPQWPGGQSCDSPYVVCLPQENTSASEFLDDHEYSLEQCKIECANDQRCMGIEFVANANSNVGSCNLIDDIPIEIVADGANPTYQGLGESAPFQESDADLSATATGSAAICYEKSQDFCNPYFGEDELTDEMIRCYCPNNRKGFYTKRVYRAVETTKFCGNDPEMDSKIRHATANRMFHLCENWCLFDVFDPLSEAWYYDPWQGCFREQYMGAGENHDTYCWKNIRDPFTVEMQFIAYRSSKFCGMTGSPTGAPVANVAGSWVLGAEYQSCDEACGDKICDENMTASLRTADSTLSDAFAEAGATCSSTVVGQPGWALPGLKIDDGTCLAREFEEFDGLEGAQGLKVLCDAKVGMGYQRLCFCRD